MVHFSFFLNIKQSDTYSNLFETKDKHWNTMNVSNILKL